MRSPVVVCGLSLLCAGCAIDRRGARPGTGDVSDGGAAATDGDRPDVVVGADAPATSDAPPAATDGGPVEEDGGPVPPDTGPPPPPITLEPLLATLPCGSMRFVSGRGCDMPDGTRSMAVLSGGDGSSVVSIRLRVRGVVELNGYDDAAIVVPPFALGGTPERAGWSDFHLDVADPPARWQLNAEAPGTDGGSYCVPIDAVLAIDVRLGTTIVLEALSEDGRGWRNFDARWEPVRVDGVSVMQPYDGQFLEVTLE